MTDADFARIKARFPKLRWRRTDGVAVSTNGYAIIWRPGRAWSGKDDWRVRFATADGPLEIQRTTLGRCLRSLECAILREAKTLAGMVGRTTCL